MLCARWHKHIHKYKVREGKTDGAVRTYDKGIPSCLKSSEGWVVLTKQRGEAGGGTDTKLVMTEGWAWKHLDIVHWWQWEAILDGITEEADLEEEDLEKSMEWVEKRGRGNTMNSEWT